MKLKQLLFGFLFFSAFTASAQKNTKEVLFTIDDKPYYTDEFSRVYKKNLDLVKDESQKDLNQYLELFVGYKLKVNRAYKLGLQNNSTYQNELKSYRSQLAKNYFNDTKITQELIEEGYNRLQKEVKAAHILILADENASPEDTLKAYKKIQDIKHRIDKGENFEELAFQLSEDPSAKENKGNLGWFSVFRMVYPFESAAFKTPKGNISLPVRTRFGYHLVKVNDVRDNRGQVTVAHIMTLNGQNPLEAETAKKTIDDVYNSKKFIVSFSPKLIKANNQIREFLKLNMYENKSVKEMTDKAEKIIKTLYIYLIKNNKKFLPSDIKNKWGLERSVADFIAGMTDKFAIDLYNKIR